MAVPRQALLPVTVIHTIVHGYSVLLVKNGKTTMNAIRIAATQASPNLAAAIAAGRPADHTVRFWWLGQAGFAVRHGSSLLLIDPYLSDTLAEKYRHSEFKHLRMMPAPVVPEQLDGCTWYLCTHGHTDHMDPGTIRGVLQAAAPAFLLPRAELARGRERGMPVERMHGINAGEIRQLTPDISAEAIAAALPPASMVINATGLGKDAPGSPLTDRVVYPENGIAWDFNYRGELIFLDQANAQKALRNLVVEDGWVYFIHGWTRVIAEVFHIDIPASGPAFDRLCDIAAKVAR